MTRTFCDLCGEPINSLYDFRIPIVFQIDREKKDPRPAMYLDAHRDCFDKLIERYREEMVK